VARRKDDFLAMLGHELRNPLAPIITAVELLKYKPSVARERDVIERHSQHLIDLGLSAGRGHGAAFTVELPTTAPVTVQAPSAQPQPSDVRAQVRVLVVDDNADTAELLSEGLKGRGFQTVVANDGGHALASWRSFDPHVGVLDLGLPGLDGYDVARALRAEYGTRAFLIAMTGYGQPTDRTRAADAGFDLHMVKPVSLEELVKALDARITAG
jgi:two-component system, sensor histidine kinase